MNKWVGLPLFESRLMHLEKKNRFLSFLLCLSGEGEETSLEMYEVEVDPGVEVVFIEGVHLPCPNLTSFVEKGGEVVFVEKDFSKIRSFISSCDWIEKEGVNIVSPSEEELKQISWRYLYAKRALIGQLDLLEKWLDGVHLTASDLHQSRLIVRNLQANLLHSYEFIDGKECKDIYRGQTAIVCGSGPSLDEEALDQIRKFEGYALVIGAGSSMPKLERAGIRIDYGVFVDPAPELEAYQKMSSLDFPLFYQNRMCHRLFSLHKGPKIWMGLSSGWDLDRELMRVAGIEGWEIDTGWNAGTFALQIAAFLGCKQIAIVGIDNGIKDERDLKKGEFRLEGHITRRDLAQGREWLNGFVENHRHIQFFMPDRGLSIEGVERSENWAAKLQRKPFATQRFTTKKIDYTRLMPMIAELNSPLLLESINYFFEALRNGVDSEGFAREKILLEVALSESGMIEWVLEKVWRATLNIVDRKEKKAPIEFEDLSVKELVAKATFYFSALKEVIVPETFLLPGLSEGLSFDGKLEGEVKRYYPGGKLAAIEHYKQGKREGKWLRLYPNGDVMAEVNYREGLNHGTFTLWGERGLKREGNYWLGRLDGLHRIWHANGNLLCEMRYDHGLPIMEHATYNHSGVLVEKMIYQAEKKFDRYCYDDRGKLSYQGVFKGDLFKEEKFDDGGKIIHERTGKWIGDRLVWD